MKITLEEALQRAIGAHKEGKLKKAKTLYESILRAQPDHSDAHHNIAVLFSALGEYELANTHCQHAVESNPRKEQYWISLTETCIRLGRISEARKILQQVIGRGFNSDKTISLHNILNPKKKLDFFYEYLGHLGVFNSDSENLLDGDSEIIPLLTRSFLDWFVTRAWSSARLLELGAGNSTLYFSKYFSSVTSLETDAQWYKTLKEKVPPNVELIKVSSTAGALRKLSDKKLKEFTTVLIDAGENRASLSRILIERDYDGILFFDNSEWYRKSITLLVNEGFIDQIP